VANGDKAAAKGWDVVAETDDHAVGFDDINYTRDLVADEVDARIAGDAAAFPASKVIISTATPPVVNGALWVKPL